jgi:two-component system chemotaxis response regulator CheY
MIENPLSREELCVPDNQAATSALDRLINRHFLVVDDEQFIRTLVAGFLKQAGASEVVEASDGRQAIKKILSYDFAFDAIISDIMMRPMNGLELLSAIRMGAEGIKRNIPVLMLTQYPELEMVGEAMRLDANAFIVKPIGNDALAERVVRVIEHAIAIQPAQDYAGIMPVRDASVAASSSHPQPASFTPAPEAKPEPEHVSFSARKVPLAKIKVNSILAEDIYVGEPPKLLLSIAAILTKATLDRLHDLHPVSADTWSLLVFEPIQPAAI